MSKNICGDILKSQLDALKRKDRKLSLRKFARMLGVSPSVVSEVINGVRTPGIRIALRISQALAFDENLHQQFIAAALETPLRINKPRLRKSLPQTSVPHGTWKHHAILELSSLPNARMEPNWISHNLNIAVIEAKKILEDLQKWGMAVGKEREIQLPEQPKEILINNGTRRSKIFHAELLAKADQSLDLFKCKDQDLSTVILAVKKSEIPYIKHKIREFQISLIGYLSQDQKDEVYALQVNLFPLTNCRGNLSNS